MNNLITRLFKKRGITDANDLSKEEQQVFEQWNKVLSKDEMTLDDVKEFCQSQISIIESRWADYSFDNKERLIPYHTVYKTILSAINSPKVAREALEKNLLQLLQQ